mgnify:FL=1
MSSYETLKNMNGTTAKHAQWCIRILDPKIIDYTFAARGETINASRFECMLVSKDPKQYMLAGIPFSFKERDSAKKAYTKFTDQSVWILKTVAFDTKVKPEFNSCPQKAVILMTEPSKLVPVTPAHTTELAHPSKHIEVALDLSGILRLLAAMPFETGSARSGSAKPQSKVLDFCGKKIALTPPKLVEKGGKRFMVSQMELVDHTGGQIKVSVWDKAYDVLQLIPDGEGITCVGSSATREGSEVKLNLWPSAHVLRGGTPAQSLTSLDASTLQVKLLTATFVPTHASIDVVDKDAHPSCAAALAEAVGCDGDNIFQVNRAFLDAPTRKEALFTKDERLFVQCRLRDQTGGVDVDVVSAAVPALYGCADEAELKDKLAKGLLEPEKARVNVRGVLRVEGGAVKKYISEIAPSSLTSSFDRAAMAMALGLTEILGDIVIPAPIERIDDMPMVGLAVRSDQREPIGAHRVLILVQGTGQSTLDGLGVGKTLQEESYKVFSPKVRCLLSTSEKFIDLIGYCGFQGMLQYRLDKDAALVLVSAISLYAPDAVSAGGPAFVATIEHMRKVTAVELAALTQSLTAECQSVLVDERTDGVSATESTYWEQPAKKLRRLDSEPL